MFQLIYADGSEARTVELPAGETLVGREAGCQLLVQHPTVSRRHAKFEVVDGCCYVEDVGSRLGTYRNGELIRRTQLADGDVLLLGKLRLEVRTSVHESVALSDLHHQIPQASLPLPGTQSDDATLVTSAVPEPGRARDLQRILVALSDIGGALVKSASLRQTLDRVVDLTFEMLPAERVFLMLSDDRTGDLVPRVARLRDGTSPQGASISGTVARQVMDERVSLLFSDAQFDQRLAGADSVAIHRIRSCLCAPLWNQSRVSGILYADSTTRKAFTAADLNLVTALGNFAAIAIEQARLSTRLLEETQRRERLQRYHSPAVVERILEGLDEARTAFVTSEREVSVLFADIVGFTSLAEGRMPSQVAHLLNGFFGAMTTVIFEREGTLDKFIGDAVLAIFGAPLSQPDHAVRCVRTALDMREALARLNRSSGAPPLRMRIGINSGPALVGDVGAPQRREFTVLGDVVNTAARLEEDVARPDQIVIGAATCHAIHGAIPTTPLGPVRLRGRTRTIEAYSL